MMLWNRGMVSKVILKDFPPKFDGYPWWPWFMKILDDPWFIILMDFRAQVIFSFASVVTVVPFSSRRAMEQSKVGIGDLVGCNVWGFGFGCNIQTINLWGWIY